MSDLAAFQYLRREDDDFHEMKDRELEEFLANSVKPRLNSLAAWDSFTPTWASTGTQPAIGNGTITAKRQIRGKECSFFVAIVMGSTTTFGTGNYGIQNVFPTNPTFGQMLSGMAVSGTAAWPIIGRASTASGNIIDFWTAQSPPVNVTPTAPFTFANGHLLYISGTVELT